MVNQSAIAGFAASGLFGSRMLVHSFPTSLWPTDNIPVRDQLHGLRRQTAMLRWVHSAPVEDRSHAHKLLILWCGQVVNINNINNLWLGGTDDLPLLLVQSVPVSLYHD